jgi:hypothetical protein
VSLTSSANSIGTALRARAIAAQAIDRLVVRDHRQPRNRGWRSPASYCAALRQMAA